MEERGTPGLDLMLVVRGARHQNDGDCSQTSHESALAY